MGTWEIPAQFKEKIIPRQCSWHWTWSPERVRDLYPRTVKPQLHRLMNPALLWATAGFPGVFSKGAWLRGLQSGREDPMKSKESSKIYIHQKQEQFPQCSGGSHPSKQIQKRWTKDKAKTVAILNNNKDWHRDSPLCCNTSTSPLLHDLTKASGRVLPEPVPFPVLDLWTDESILSQMPGDTKDLPTTDRLQGRRNITVAWLFFRVT